MKGNLRGKFRDFLASEEGRVGIKAPLAVGIAGGSLLLAQAVLPTSVQAHGNHVCPPCDDGEVCVAFKWEWSPYCPCWMELPQWHYTCVEF